MYIHIHIHTYQIHICIYIYIHINIYIYIYIYFCVCGYANTLCPNTLCTNEPIYICIYNMHICIHIHIIYIINVYIYIHTSVYYMHWVYRPPVDVVLIGILSILGQVFWHQMLAWQYKGCDWLANHDMYIYIYIWTQM